MGVTAIFPFVRAPLILSGFALELVGLLRLFRGPPGTDLATTSRPEADAIDWRTGLFVCLAIAAIGAVVRLTGLDAHGLSHPEIYTPGLDLPAGISEPPPRHGFVETLSWHFHSEPHPFGYYMAMWAWTKAVGASAMSIRLPEALLGVACIPLTYRIGTLAYSRRVGLIAAALLALNGFHIFWSQAARMYAPGAFLGLLSTLLLMELSNAPERRRWLEAGYIASLLACALTVEFTWPLLAIHMVWAALNRPRDASGVARLPVLQAMAAALAAPMLSDAIMTGRNDAAEAPSLTFLMHYFSFGFAFEHGAYPDPWPGLPPPFYPLVLIFSLALTGLGLNRPPKPPSALGSAAKGWAWSLATAAAGACALMAGFVVLSYGRRAAMAAACILPWLVIAIPLAAARVRPMIGRWAPRLDRQLDRRPMATGLIPLLALLPVLGIFVISYKLDLTAPRAFAIFTPYLLVLIAAGVDRLAHRRILAGAVLAGLLVTMIASVAILSRAPNSPRDYRSLAAEINADRRPGDLIFVPPKHWKYTPLFVYLPHASLVAADFAKAAAAPQARVWVPSLEDKPPPAIAAALAAYRPVLQVKALRAAATLYVRTPGAR